MKKLILAACLTIFLFTFSASAQRDYCFENKGLKGSILITFGISGIKVTDGEFSFSEYTSTTSSDTFHFKGTKNGKVLTINFGGKAPQEFSTIKKIIWTLGLKTLKVQMYGKNYQTNKWSVYSAAFDKCSQ